MYNPEYSYWIDISGPSEAIEKAKSFMAQNATIAESFICEQNESGDLHYEVKDGTIPKWTDCEDEMAAIAIAVPEISMILEEIDEESQCTHILSVYMDGGLEYQMFGRNLDPDQFDSVTVNHCIELLEKNGMTDAAKLLKDMNIAV